MSTAIDKAYARLVAAVPYAAWLDIQIEQVEPGDDACAYRLPFRADLLGNPHLPALHGGVVASFLELAMQFEVLLAEDQQRLPYPVDFSIDYWRSAQARDTRATCRLIRQGRRVAQVQVECWQDMPERPIAFARADFLLRDAEPMGGSR